MEHLEPLPCISCGITLDAAASETQNQPYAGTAFESRGHYGSTVFDPMDNSSFLEVIVCDDCLIKYKNERVAYGQESIRRTRTYLEWEPSKCCT